MWACRRGRGGALEGERVLSQAWPWTRPGVRRKKGPSHTRDGALQRRRRGRGTAGRAMTAAWAMGEGSGGRMAGVTHARRMREASWFAQAEGRRG